MRYLLTFMMLFFVSIVEASPTPGWVLGRGHMEYDPTQYLTGVGYSKENSISASGSARSELIKSIRVQINAVSKDYNSTGKSFAESSVHTSTDFLLEGSQVKDGWYDEEKEIYYSLVVIKRQYVLESGNRLDLLLKDRNEMVVVEIKLDNIGKEVYNQINGYIKELRNEFHKKVKGVIVCRDILPAFEDFYLKKIEKDKIKVYFYSWKFNLRQFKI